MNHLEATQKSGRTTICLRKLLIFFKWGMVAVVCLIILAIIGIVFYLVVIVPWEIEQGHHWKGISYRFYTAMKQGDSKDAIYWAKKGYAYEILGKGGQIHDSEKMIGQAYELDGQYDLALHWYEICKEPPDELVYARVYFKQGKRSLAFEFYCRFAEICINDPKSKLESEEWNARNMQLGRIRDEILIENFPFMRLAPFITFREFMDFAEKEYAESDASDEFARAMKLFRAIDTEILEWNLPRSKASDSLERQREEIKQERQINSQSDNQK